jgi:hypothetical protein
VTSSPDSASDPPPRLSPAIGENDFDSLFKSLSKSLFFVCFDEDFNIVLWRIVFCVN